MANISFLEKESSCEFRFREAIGRLGGFWHYCTPGHLNESVNITEEDYIFSMNNLAVSASEARVVVLTDSHMSNHLHTLLGCRREQCFEFEEAYLYRLRNHLRAQEREVDLRAFRCTDPIPVKDLAMMRTEIVYVHRNRYVIDPRFTPCSDPWSGGSVYFNLRLDDRAGIAYNDLTYRQKLALCLRSEPKPIHSYRVLDGRILPTSYLDYRLGESFFRDAHHYFSLLTRNAESYSEVAKRLGDRVVLTEEEMYQTVNRIAKRDYNLNLATRLPPKAKIEIAKKMHFDYNASNSQIQRLLKLDMNLVRELFPLQERQ